jgi:hypothetical protein
MMDEAAAERDTPKSKCLWNRGKSHHEEIQVERGLSVSLLFALSSLTLEQSPYDVMATAKVLKCTPTLEKE